MELNNIENQFRKQLNEREIKPTETAWDRLDTMLTVADPSYSELAKQKPKKKYSWLYIAASIAGFLMIGTIFFNQKENRIDTRKNNVVIQNSIPSKSTEVTATKELNKKSVHNENLAIQEVKKAFSKPNKIPASNKESVIINNSQNQVAVSINNQKTEQKSNSFQPSTISVDELLASVENSKKENQLQQKSAVKVDANNLLSQVDGELELSFREKVIHKVGKNYQTVKVALANRNQE